MYRGYDRTPDAMLCCAVPWHRSQASARDGEMGSLSLQRGKTPRPSHRRPGVPGALCAFCVDPCCAVQESSPECPMDHSAHGVFNTWSSLITAVPGDPEGLQRHPTCTCTCTCTCTWCVACRREPGISLLACRTQHNVSNEAEGAVEGARGEG